MKALILTLLLFTMNAMSQVADAPADRQTDPQIESAKALAQKFIEKVFSEDYQAAEKLMNPAPPEKKGVSSSDFKKERIAQIKRVVDRRNEVSKERVWDKIVEGKFHTRTERPPEEEFADFTFWSTYPNGA